MRLSRFFTAGLLIQTFLCPVSYAETPMAVVSENTHTIEKLLHSWGRSKKSVDLDATVSPVLESMEILSGKKKEYGIRSDSLDVLKEKFPTKELLVPAMKELGFSGLSDSNGVLQPLEDCSIDDLYNYYNCPSQSEWGTIIGSVTHNFFADSLSGYRAEKRNFLEENFKQTPTATSSAPNKQVMGMQALLLAVEYITVHNTKNDLDEMIRFTQDRLKNRYSQRADETYLKWLLTYHNTTDISLFTRVQASFHQDEWTKSWRDLVDPSSAAYRGSFLYRGTPRTSLSESNTIRLASFLEKTLKETKVQSFDVKELKNLYRALRCQWAKNTNTQFNTNVVTLLAMIDVIEKAYGSKKTIWDTVKDTIGTVEHQDEKGVLSTWVDSVYDLATDTVTPSSVLDPSIHMDTFIYEKLSPKKLFGVENKQTLPPLEAYTSAIENQNKLYNDNPVFRFWYNVGFISHQPKDSYHRGLFHTPQSFMEWTKRLGEELINKKASTYDMLKKKLEIFTLSDVPSPNVLKKLAYHIKALDDKRENYRGSWDNTFAHWLKDMLKALDTDQFEALMDALIRKDPGFFRWHWKGKEAYEAFKKSSDINDKKQRQHDFAKETASSYRARGYEKLFGISEIREIRELFNDSFRKAFEYKRKKAISLLDNGIYAGSEIPKIFKFMSIDPHFKDVFNFEKTNSLKEGMENLERDVTLDVNKTLKNNVKEMVASIPFKGDLTETEQEEILVTLNLHRWGDTQLLPARYKMFSILQEHFKETWRDMDKEKKESIAEFLDYLNDQDTFRWSIQRDASWWFLSTWTQPWEQILLDEKRFSDLSLMERYRHEVYLKLLSERHSLAIEWSNRLIFTKSISPISSAVTAFNEGKK